MEKISAVVITKNNEKTIKQCLDSIKHLDEVIIVDNGSSDQTLHIAKKIHNVRIFSQDWLGYAGQKNFGISKAKNKWVLSLDSDECLPESLFQEIQGLNFSLYDGFYLPRLTYFLDQPIWHCGWYPDHQIRLFKKTKMKFSSDAVHEKVAPVGQIGKLKNHLLHHSYQTTGEYFERLNHYTTLEASLDKYKKIKPPLKTYLKLLTKPVYRFFKMYLWQKGFLDGLTGLKLCIFSSYYDFIVFAKVYYRVKHEKR